MNKLEPLEHLSRYTHFVEFLFHLTFHYCAAKHLTDIS